jgi:hypothetical protein
MMNLCLTFTIQNWKNEGDDQIRNENAFKLDVPLDVELELVKTQHIRTLKLKLDSFRLKKSIWKLNFQMDFFYILYNLLITTLSGRLLFSLV